MLREVYNLQTIWPFVAYKQPISSRTGSWDYRHKSEKSNQKKVIHTEKHLTLDLFVLRVAGPPFCTFCMSSMQPSVCEHIGSAGAGSGLCRCSLSAQEEVRQTKVHEKTELWPSAVSTPPAEGLMFLLAPQSSILTWRTWLENRNSRRLMQAISFLIKSVACVPAEFRKKSILLSSMKCHQFQLRVV